MSNENEYTVEKRYFCDQVLYAVLGPSRQTKEEAQSECDELNRLIEERDAYKASSDIRGANLAKLTEELEAAKAAYIALARKFHQDRFPSGDSVAIARDIRAGGNGDGTAMNDKLTDEPASANKTKKGN